MSKETGSPPGQRVTCGGLPYHYIPSSTKERWAQMIAGLSLPAAQSGSAWREYKDMAIDAANRFLPQAAKDALRRIANGNDAEYDGIVFDNLPHTTDPSNQTDDELARSTADSEAVLVGLVGVAGCEVFGYRQEKLGKLIQRIEPLHKHERTQSNAGRVKFGFHSDNSCFAPPFQPQLLALLGSVNQSDAATLLLTLADILPNIPPKLLAALREPIFRRRAPDSFDFGGYMVVSAPGPLIYDGDDGSPRVALPAAAFRQESRRAERAMRDFRELLDGLRPRSVVVAPGRLLAFRNTRVVHGRAAFAGRRLLHRAYFANSLVPHRAAARANDGAQVFDARFFIGA